MGRLTIVFPGDGSKPLKIDTDIDTDRLSTLLQEEVEKDIKARLVNKQYWEESKPATIERKKYNKSPTPNQQLQDTGKLIKSINVIKEKTGVSIKIDRYYNFNKRKYPLWSRGSLRAAFDRAWLRYKEERSRDD